MSILIGPKVLLICDLLDKISENINISILDRPKYWYTEVNFSLSHARSILYHIYIQIFKTSLFNSF